MLKKVTFFRIIFVILFVALVGLLLLQRLNYLSAIEAAEAWARLPPIEQCNSHPDVEARGGMFSRTIIIEFKCDAGVLKEWVHESPGLSNATFTSENGENVYSVKPGGGAVFAEVKINWSKNTVYIKAFWS